MENLTLDLTTLYLDVGSHIVTAKARAKGFLDSPFSDPVSYYVATPPAPDVEQLPAPTIELVGDILTMDTTDNRTEEFVILVDGVEMATVQNLISFTIEGTTYQAVGGMTWGEWVESEYNTGGYTSTNNAVIVGDAQIVTSDGVSVKPSEKIIQGHSYGKYVA